MVVDISWVYALYPAAGSTEKFLKKGFIKKAINEFEYVKKILVVEISLLVAVYPVIWLLGFIEGLMAQPNQGTISYILGTVTNVLLFSLPGGILKIVLLTVRRHFPFYFAKGCLSVISNLQEDFEKMQFLILGLEAYNKYLRRRLKYQINHANIQKFYFEYLYANV